MPASDSSWTARVRALTVRAFSSAVIARHSSTRSRSASGEESVARTPVPAGSQLARSPTVRLYASRSESAPRSTSRASSPAHRTSCALGRNPTSGYTIRAARYVKASARPKRIQRRGVQRDRYQLHLHSYGPEWYVQFVTTPVVPNLFASWLGLGGPNVGANESRWFSGGHKRDSVTITEGRKCGTRALNSTAQRRRATRLRHAQPVASTRTPSTSCHIWSVALRVQGLPHTSVEVPWTIG